MPKPLPLTDEMLLRFQERAPGYDQQNRFFTEDFEELRASGYLNMAIPRELGGLGMTLAEVSREQRRLGYYAPADALAVNMHLYWTGLAADLWRAGDKSLEWLLRAAAGGAVLAAGHAESGNDIPVLLSTTRAERVEGGYRFYGRKHFGSLTPVWTLLGIHGIDTSDPARPMIVHGFLPRDGEGFKVVETWDTLGMRATRSDDTVLDGAFVPDRYITRRVPAGAAGVDAFVLGVFAWALIGFGNIYFGLARRALDLTVEMVKQKKSIGLSRPMAYHAEVQHAVAEMVLEMEAIGRTWTTSRRSGPTAWTTGRPGSSRSSRRSTTRSRGRGGWWITRSSWPAGSASSGRGRSSGCSVMPGWAGSIRRTRCSRTSWRRS